VRHAKRVGRRRSDRDRDLEQVWDQIPPVQGRGLCAQACGPIDASTREKQRLGATGVQLLPRSQALAVLADTGAYRCPALTDTDQCSAYQDRPTVCRLWGAMQSLPCPYGCLPDQLLDDATGLALLAQSLHAGGDSGRRWHRTPTGLRRPGTRPATVRRPRRSPRADAEDGRHGQEELLTARRRWSAAPLNVTLRSSPTCAARRCSGRTPTSEAARLGCSSRSFHYQAGGTAAGPPNDGPEPPRRSSGATEVQDRAEATPPAAGPVASQVLSGSCPLTIVCGTLHLAVLTRRCGRSRSVSRLDRQG
jgi:hypothetical protein